MKQGSEFNGVTESVGPKASATQLSSDPDSIAHFDFLVWQLMDSAFPTGGFAHSFGLEAAWQHGEVRGRAELLEFAKASLDQLGHGSLPFVLAAYDAPEQLAELDSLFDVFTTNHVANRASRSQGRAFLTAVERAILAVTGDPQCSIPFAHFAPAFGASLRRLRVSRDRVGRMFFFNHLRGVLAAAVRLNITGPMEAQRLQYHLSSQAERIRKACEPLTLDQVAQTAPLLEVWHGAQERLYSRLFQS